MLYQRSSDGMQNAVISLGGYYRAPEWEATAKIGFHSVSLSYHQKFKDYFTLVCDLEGSLMQVHQYLVCTIQPRMFKTGGYFHQHTNLPRSQADFSLIDWIVKNMA